MAQTGKGFNALDAAFILTIGLLLLGLPLAIAL
jgi:hypothetical protein